jgi:hypothetical protein
MFCLPEEKRNLLRLFSNTVEKTLPSGKIVTGKETWVFQHDPETKHQYMQWNHIMWVPVTMAR